MCLLLARPKSYSCLSRDMRARLPPTEVYNIVQLHMEAEGAQVTSISCQVGSHVRQVQAPPSHSKLEEGAPGGKGSPQKRTPDSCPIETQPEAMGRA
jgi:hypothetical protein